MYQKAISHYFLYTYGREFKSHRLWFATFKFVIVRNNVGNSLKSTNL